MTERLGRWLWVPALVSAVVSIVGLAGSPIVNLMGPLLIGPPVIGVGVALWGGRRKFTAGLFGVLAVQLVGAVTWYDCLTRQTLGSNVTMSDIVAVAVINEVMAKLHLGVNYVLAVGSAILAFAWIRWFSPPKQSDPNSSEC